MKRIGLFAFLLIAAISFAASQGLGELLDNIDQSMVIYFGIFLISFALLFFALNKIFKSSSSIAGIISAVLAFMITYGAHKSGLDMENYLFDLGISGSFLSAILPLIIIGGLVLLIIKFKGGSLYIIGGLMIVASLFVYAKALLLTIGSLLIGLGVWMGIRKQRNAPKS